MLRYSKNKVLTLSLQIEDNKKVFLSMRYNRSLYLRYILLLFFNFYRLGYFYFCKHLNNTV